MKKSLLFLTAVLFTALTSFTSTSDFEGKIVYAVDLSGANMPPEIRSMFAGSKSIIYLKGTKSRTEMDMGMQKTISIYDAKTNTSVALMEVMGNKYKIKNQDKKDEKKPEIKVNVTSLTKTIAGYICKKAEVTIKDDKGGSIVNHIWFTEAISNRMNINSENGYQFKDIKGMPLEYEMKASNGMVLKMTATSIVKENVSDSWFEVPAGYTEVTPEEMQRDMMKKMSGH